MRLSKWLVALTFSALLLTCGYTPSIRGDSNVTPEGFLALAEPSQQRACLRAAVFFEKWKPRLKLSDWSIHFICGVPDDWKDRQDGLHGASRVDASHQGGTLWFNPTSDKDPEIVVIHELTHFVIQEIVESQSLMVEERSVYNLAELIYKGRDIQ
jgi:hypothetical protein